MSNCIDYQCDELDDHLLNECGQELLGGQDQVLIVDCDAGITDPSDGTQLLAAIAAGTVRLVQNVKFGIDAPSPIEMDSTIALRSSKVVNYDRTASMIDGNINSQNVNIFYPKLLNGRTIAGLIVYENGNSTKKVTWINAAVQAVGGRILPADNNEFQRYEITFKWKNINDPRIYNAPVGVFS